MENNDELYRLPDGRVFVDYGPVSMVITARKDGKMAPELADGVLKPIREALSQLAGVLPRLRAYSGSLDPSDLSGLARRMADATLAVAESTLTPMATVAGAMADLAAQWIWQKGADTVIVNNGGDIALRQKAGGSIRMGILPDLGNGQVDTVVAIRAEEGIGGVCTSGLGGRSLTRGIAGGVTVFSRDSLQADACATHIANTSYVESPRVHTCLAGELDPGSDIAALTVVTQVDPLTEEEIRQGLSQMRREMERQREMGNLIKAAADIQGRKLYFPEDAWA